MQLNELTGIKNIKVEKQNIREFLESLGFEYLNSGGFASTYKGKNSVLRIFEDDKGYEQYVNFIKSVPSKFKQFVPKVTSVKAYPYNTDVKFIKIELLEEPENTPYEDIISYTAEFLAFIPKQINDFNQINNLNKIENIFKTFEKKYLDFFNDYKKYIDFSLLEFLFYLKKQTPKYIYWDIGPGNIMMRGKQFVVTDPWVH